VIPSDPGYELDGRERIAEAPGLRVQVLTLGPGQCVPWHRHTRIHDTFFCLEGQVVLSTREPEAATILEPGDSAVVPPDRPHRVAPGGGARCRFVIVQGVGEYDYVPDDDPAPAATRRPKS
jgi:quercetin dioxygenase-like cupin family protein